MTKENEAKKIKFLSALIETRSQGVAAKAAGVSVSTASRWAAKYSNVLEVQFETLGLRRDDVMKQHINQIKEPPVKIKVVNMKDDNGMITQKAIKEVDAGAHLKAIELYYEVTGIKKTGQDITIAIEQSNNNAVEKDIYDSLPADVKAKIRGKIIEQGANNDTQKTHND